VEIAGDVKVRLFRKVWGASLGPVSLIERLYSLGQHFQGSAPTPSEGMTGKLPMCFLRLDLLPVRSHRWP